MHCSGAIKISEFAEWGERHNGGHVIHVTQWWRHGKQRRRGGPVASLSMRSSREVVYRVWINSGSSSDGYAIFWYPDGKVGSCLFCKVSVVTRSWWLTPQHAKLCEPVGKWPAAILTGPWIRRTESGTRIYILNWTQFHDSAVIARCSLLISLSDKMLWSILSDCPFF